MPKGGKRPGAGRKKGGQNRATSKIKAHVVKLLESGEEMPLDFLLRTMREPEPVKRDDESSLSYKLRYETWRKDRLQAAIAAGPYCHNRLTAIEHTGKDGGPMQHRFEIEFVSPERDA